MTLDKLSAILLVIGWICSWIFFGIKVTFVILMFYGALISALKSD